MNLLNFELFDYLDEAIDDRGSNAPKQRIGRFCDRRSLG